MMIIATATSPLDNYNIYYIYHTLAISTALSCAAAYRWFSSSCCKWMHCTNRDRSSRHCLQWWYDMMMIIIVMIMLVMMLMMTVMK